MHRTNTVRERRAMGTSYVCACSHACMCMFTYTQCARGRMHISISIDIMHMHGRKDIYMSPVHISDI